MRSQGSGKSLLPTLRFGQCWEDADVLLQALDVRPEHTCLSIASGGDNTLALLSRSPQRVIAIDMNPAQLACLELKVAAYRELTHTELLVLNGSRPGTVRDHLYRRCRPHLSPDAQAFWDGHASAIAEGIGGAGSFEQYLAKFRASFLRWVQKEKGVERFFRANSAEARQRYFDKEWDNWRWKTVTGNFFAKQMLKEMGRDSSYLRGAGSNWAQPLVDRLVHVLTEEEPAENPYLQWLFIGRHTTALPYALRPENFDAIRANLDRLEWHCSSLNDYLTSADGPCVDRFNMGDIFEPMSPDDYSRSLDRVIRAGRPGARLVYWNMLVEKHRPKELAHRLRPMEAMAAKLEPQDKSIFHTELVIEGST